MKKILFTKPVKSYSLGSTDLKKIAVHFGVYFLGMGLIGGLTYLAGLDLGAWTPVVGLVVGALIDAVRKSLDGVRE